MPDVEVIKIVGLPLDDLQPMLEESREQGFEFLDRLVEEYLNGTNRFEGDKEVLFGVYLRSQMVAIGGLNQDPYNGGEGTGRVRHLYVLSAYRRQGIGSLLMDQIINQARKHFRILRLRTFHASADAFYRSLGFQKAPGVESATHQLPLAP